MAKVDYFLKEKYLKAYSKLTNLLNEVMRLILQANLYLLVRFIIMILISLMMLIEPRLNLLEIFLHIIYDFYNLK